jgi:hypothetical protein
MYYKRREQNRRIILFERQMLKMKDINHFERRIGAILLLCFFISPYGINLSHARFLEQKEAKKLPQGQFGCYPTPTLGTRFMDNKNLGTHKYRSTWSEKNGLAYTCKAGHIDIYHVREAADWTAYLADKTFEHLEKNETEFSFKLKEGSLCFVKLTEPENWKDLSQNDKERTARDISIKLGQYLAFMAGNWHEIITWFGYKSSGFYTEFPSAFSWEDNFSNILGCYLAVLALQDTEHTFDEAMTLALDRELRKLDIQPRRVAKRASEKMRGLWYSGDFLSFVHMKKRHFDIGLDNGFVTPAIVPGVCECEGAQPQPYPAPTIGSLSEYGFSVKVEIEPREWEAKKVLRIVYPDSKERKNRIEPDKHFASIMAYIKKDALKRFGYDVDLSSADPQKQAQIYSK